MSDLDDILSDEPIVEETPELDAEEPTQEDQEPVTEEPAPQPDPEPQTVPLAALQETRSENKELKAALAALQSQVSQAQQPRYEQPKQPDFIDQEGAAYFQQYMGQMQAHFAAELSEAKARAKYGDDTISQAFEAAQAAGMVDRFKGQQDPWGALGEWHKGVQEQEKAKTLLSEIGGDLEAYKAKIKAELLAEMNANQVAESVAQAARAKAPSLASEPNLGSRAAPQWSGPTPLDDILG